MIHKCLVMFKKVNHDNPSNRAVKYKCIELYDITKYFNSV